MYIIMYVHVMYLLMSLCVAGKVYNVTEFMKYHPGGKAQLMRGAGIDCTELFAKVHMHICTYTCMHVHMYSFLILQILKFANKSNKYRFRAQLLIELQNLLIDLSTLTIHRDTHDFSALISPYTIHFLRIRIHFSAYSPYT